MKKFTSIEKFRHIIKKVNRKYMFNLIGDEYVYDPLLTLPTLNFTGTVKLHGTNASIRLQDGAIVYQSRNNVIDSTNDNCGFVNHMSSIQQSHILELFNKIGTKFDDITIYGEWIGKGIQSKVAITKLEEKQFVIFSIKVVDDYFPNFKELCLHEYNIYNILEIPSYNIEIDFNNLEKTKEKMETWVTGVDKQCPWAKKFGIDGIGEGLVFICDEFPTYSDFWFKVKGNSHKGSPKDKIKIDIDPVVQKSINDFVEYSVNISRLNQGIEYLQETNLELCIVSVGKFLKWMSIDINKEEYDVLKESNLIWKDVVKSINIKSKDWYIDYIDKL